MFVREASLREMEKKDSLTREVYLLPDLLAAGDVGAALVDAEIGLADVSIEAIQF